MSLEQWRQLTRLLASVDTVMSTLSLLIPTLILLFTFTAVPGMASVVALTYFVFSALILFWIGLTCVGIKRATRVVTAARVDQVENASQLVDTLGNWADINVVLMVLSGLFGHPGRIIASVVFRGGLILVAMCYMGKVRVESPDGVLEQELHRCSVLKEKQSHGSGETIISVKP